MMAGTAPRVLLSLLVVCLVQPSGSIPAPGSASSSSSSSQHLKVSAFNIEILGVTKMGKPEVVERLVEIIVRSDIVMIQEIRDASGQAIVDLLDAVNRASASDPYEMELSIRLGRTSSKEQYAYFYRPSKFSVVATYQYHDPFDVFERPPFCVRFKTVGHNDIKEFGYIGVHVKLSDAVAEINHLANVYDLLREHWKMQDFLIGGDLNADCKHVTKSNWKDIRLRTDPRFRWLIADDVDTTVYHSECAYDRLIIVGDAMYHSYLSDSAIAYRFDDEMNLDYDQAKAVSDHVPVEMILR